MLWAFQNQLRKVEDPAVRNSMLCFAVAGLVGGDEAEPRTRSP